MHGDLGDGKRRLGPEAPNPLNFSRWSNTLCDIPSNLSWCRAELKQTSFVDLPNTKPALVVLAGWAAFSPPFSQLCSPPCPCTIFLWLLAQVFVGEIQTDCSCAIPQCPQKSMCHMGSRTETHVTLRGLVQLVVEIATFKGVLERISGDVFAKQLFWMPCWQLQPLHLWSENLCSARDDGFNMEPEQRTQHPTSNESS